MSDKNTFYLKYKKKYNQTEKGKQARRKYNKRYYSKTASLYPEREFNEIEDTLILEHRWTDTQLAQTIHRSVASIQTRRWRLKNKRKKVI